MSDEEARSTDRPPAPGDDVHPDIAAAVKRAKANASPGRYGPAQATAKMGAFDLAEALARTTADGEEPPSSSRPLREDDAPFVAGDVEVVGEEELPSSGVNRGSLPSASDVAEPLDKSKAASIPPEDDGAAVVPRPASRLGIVILAAIVGLLVIAYVYVRTR